MSLAGRVAADWLGLPGVAAASQAQIPIGHGPELAHYHTGVSAGPWQWVPAGRGLGGGQLGLGRDPQEREVCAPLLLGAEDPSLPLLLPQPSRGKRGRWNRG